MKEHIQAKLTNELREIAVKFHAHKCLRDLISECVQRNINEDKRWHESIANKQ